MFALILDMYHSYLKSKREPPKWIVFVVFTLVPSTMVSAMGISVKSHADQVEDIKKELEKARTEKVMAKGNMKLAQTTRRDIVKLEEQLHRTLLRQEMAESSDESEIDDDGDVEDLGDAEDVGDDKNGGVAWGMEKGISDARENGVDSGPAGA